MSLYNLIAGRNPSTAQFMQLLGKNTADFGRFRDVYIDNDYIVVHTRCGGGNREDYIDMFEEMEMHPWYSHDEDCDFDNTYANLYFRIPDDQSQTLIKLLDSGINPNDMWNSLLKNH